MAAIVKDKSTLEQKVGSTPCGKDDIEIVRLHSGRGAFSLVYQVKYKGDLGHIVKVVMCNTSEDMAAFKNEVRNFHIYAAEYGRPVF